MRKRTLLAVAAIFVGLFIANRALPVPSAAPVRVPTAPPCILVYGACVLFDDDSPTDVRAYVVSRLERAFEASAAYWGTKPDALRGWVVIYHGYTPLNLQIAGYTNDRIRRVDVTLPWAFCPEMVFVHEWGHASDIAAGGTGRKHGKGPEDPRFDAASIQKALARLPGCSP